MDCLSLKEQHELKGAAWYQAGIPREISLEVLNRQSPGAFLVRQSSTKPGCFALSLRVPPPAPKVAHYLILRTVRGYKIKVSSPFFAIHMCEHKLLSFCTGFYKGILFSESINHPPLRHAGTAASTIVSTTTSNTEQQKDVILRRRKRR